jgi:hypothetical protein
MGKIRRGGVLMSIPAQAVADRNETRLLLNPQQGRANADHYKGS